MRQVGSVAALRWRRAGAATLLALIVFAAGGQAADASVLGTLAGRWTGWGTIVLGNGNSEQVRCIATYLVKSPTSLQQNLRCASASYKIDAVADLAVENDQVSGNWEERTYESAGSVSGRVTGGGINLSIQGPSFSAVMAVTVSECQQSINIAPRGIDVTRISIGLGKC